MTNNLKLNYIVTKVEWLLIVWNHKKKQLFNFSLREPVHRFQIQDSQPLPMLT